MNEEKKKRQKLLRYLVLAFVGAVSLAFSWVVISDYFDAKVSPKRTYATNTHLPLDGIDPKEIWVDQIRTENEVVQGKVDYMQEMLIKRVKEESDREHTTQSEISALRNEIENLRTELKRKHSSEIPVSQNLREELHHVAANYQQPQLAWQPFDNSPPPMLPQEMYSPLTSVTCPNNANLHYIDRTIPAGTTVKAILMSSVDMPCGVRASSDPLPVKLRIIADGRLPHKIRARLKSGIVTASVYGDLSSERVFLRLEKLTQIRADGHFIETQVAGYVSGEDGKYGLRGTVVDKSAQLVENALISGFLSGASNFFEAAAMARLYPGTVYGSCAPTEGCNINWSQSAGQLAVAGGSGGVTNALDALTGYFIERAEQLRPVIQITPGRIVDITFSDSADLGDLYTHERVRNNGRNETCGS